MRTLIFPIILLSATSLSAMDFICGQKDSEEKDLKYSTCTWTSAIHFVSKPLAGKPAANDLVWVREQGYHLAIDRDFAVKSFKVGFNASCSADGRNLKIKGDYIQQISGGAGNDSKAVFKNTIFDVGGAMKFGSHPDSTEMSIAYLSLENSKLSVKGGMTFIVESAKIRPDAARAGIFITLAGKSELNIGDELQLDSLVRENPAQYMFKMVFTEKDSEMPIARFKKADFKSCDIEVNIGKDAKSGKYTLLEIENARGSVEGLYKFTVNGKSCKLGDTVDIDGKRSATFSAAASGKDTRTKNDIVVEIK